MCTTQDISNIPFIIRGNHFRVHGHKKDLPHMTCIFHVFKYVVEIVLVSAILHHISLLRLLPKLYFKISTFQPNVLCSSSFKPFFNHFLSQSLQHMTYLKTVIILSTHVLPPPPNQLHVSVYLECCVPHLTFIPQYCVHTLRSSFNYEYLFYALLGFYRFAGFEILK